MCFFFLFFRLAADIWAVLWGADQTDSRFNGEKAPAPLQEENYLGGNFLSCSVVENSNGSPKDSFQKVWQRLFSNQTTDSSLFICYLTNDFDLLDDHLSEYPLIGCLFDRLIELLIYFKLEQATSIEGRACMSARFRLTSTLLYHITIFYWRWNLFRFNIHIKYDNNEKWSFLPKSNINIKTACVLVLIFKHHIEESEY